jgi:hypothetical protein
MKLSEILEEHSPLEMKISLEIIPHTPFTVSRGFKAGDEEGEAKAIASTWLGLRPEMMNDFMATGMSEVRCFDLLPAFDKPSFYPPLTGLISESYIYIQLSLTVAKDPSHLKGFFEIWGDDWHKEGDIWLLTQSYPALKALLNACARPLYK